MMLNTRQLVAMAAVALACRSACAEKLTMVCDLRGAQETPPVATPARGCGTFIIDTNANTITYRIVYGGLSANETAAHFHKSGGPGIAGGVIAALPAGSPKVGVAQYLEVDEPDLLAGKFYVNIHTTAFPGGEIRGQVNDFVAVLDGPQENPAVPGGFQGWGTLNIDRCANTLTYYIMIESLSGPEVASHIHGFSLPGTNSGVLQALPAGMIKSGTMSFTEAQEQLILDGMTYVNVHTAANPGGEIRGQIVNSMNPIDGLQETPPVGTPAIGCACMSIERSTNTMGYYMLHGGLLSAETAAHIHGFAGPGIPAGVLMPLAAGSPKKGIWPYGAAAANNVLAGLTYANIHTLGFPGGEIRGQLTPALPPCRADVNCSGSVDVTDLLAVIGAWGPCPIAPALCPADVNYSGSVDVTDLLAIIGGWGACP